VALQLANAKADALYHCQPFHDGQPVRLMQGCWVWSDNHGLGQGDIEARVELAADGSTNSVNVKFLLNLSPIMQRQGRTPPFVMP
jgi:hypothetical protein